MSFSSFHGPCLLICDGLSSCCVKAKKDDSKKKSSPQMTTSRSPPPLPRLSHLKDMAHKRLEWTPDETAVAAAAKAAEDVAAKMAEAIGEELIIQEEAERMRREQMGAEGTGRGGGMHMCS